MCSVPTRLRPRPLPNDAAEACVAIYLAPYLHILFQEEDKDTYVRSMLEAVCK